MSVVNIFQFCIQFICQNQLQQLKFSIACNIIQINCYNSYQKSNKESSMQNCISKFIRAPIQYINELRGLKTGSITMDGTSFFPAFPVSLISSLLCLCGLSAYMIYYFFTSDQNVCYSNITYGIIALAIIYPIQSIVIYICVFGSVALAKSNCWKVFTIIFFGLIVTGFSFGGLGFAFLCTISKVHPLLIPSTFLSSNTFIQIIVYSYLSFFGLYLILVPLLTVSYNQRNKDPNPQSSCFDTFCCVVYYICQFLFMITALFMICIKLLGPPLLIYVLIQVARAGFQNNLLVNLSAFFALSILSIFLPIFIFTVVYLISNFACKKTDQQHSEPAKTEPTQIKQLKQFQSKPNQIAKQPQKRRSIFLTSDESKTFGDQIDSSNNGEIKNQLL